jgi:UDP-N-acetyl-alpha-D-quinovosamine dehydrogenase
VAAVKIVVTGANGFVGQPMCAALRQRGHEVRRIVRHAPAPGGQPDTFAIGSIDERTNWSEALQGADVVIHLAARAHVMRENAADPLAAFRRINVDGTERLARAAAAAGVRRMVFVSSIKVNGEATAPGAKFTEEDVPAPRDAYAISKLEAEDALHRVARETALEVVILRPPLVYGPRVKGNFLQMINALAEGVPLPLASIRNLRSLVYVGNLADALIACATHPAAAGQTYLLCDGEDVSTPALLRTLAAALGVSARLFPFPPWLLRMLAKLAGKGAQTDRLVGSLRVDSGKIRGQLDWTPPHTLQQGLQATADWYRTENRI